MKTVKISITLILLVVIAIFTAPYWASCKINNHLCNLSCHIKHYDSEISQTTCKAKCLAKQVSCAGKELTAPLTDE